jgi:hypothetical protein
MDSQFIDIAWLNRFGLDTSNVLNYFYGSPFYDPNCNNEIIRAQGIKESHLMKLQGIEYALDLQACKEPHLYVVKKVNRQSQTKVELLDVFYCLNGIFYQSPLALDVFHSRLLRSSWNLKRSLSHVHSVVYKSEYLNPKNGLGHTFDEPTRGTSSSGQQSILNSAQKAFAKEVALDVLNVNFD